LNGAPYNGNIGVKQCPITIVFVHANLPNLKLGHPSLFALESIATFFPEACIIIQTSLCSFHNPLPIAEEMNLSLEQSIYLRLFTMVEEQTHDMMERGQVRVTFLNHEKYNLKACDDFSFFSNALMNANYWNDEFNDRDSNRVMIVREGTVLCHHFDIGKFTEYGFVASPLSNKDNIFGGSDYCNTMKDLWKLAHRNKIKRNNNSSNKHAVTVDGVMSSIDERNAMANILQSCLRGVGPMSIQDGTGLLYFNREITLQAIQMCPHETLSGIEQNVEQLHPHSSSCVWRGKQDTSLYFSTILAAMMGTRLPTGIVASLFSTNQIWPEQAIESYGGPFFNFNRQVLATKYNCIYRGANIRTAVSGKVEKRTVPISLQVHFDESLKNKQELLSHDVVEQCPFIQYIL
jgi:hypothetical protein